ncbi:MAG TPA: hypothetical protein VGK02_09805 [Candidatus Aquicultor sp.]|jgi:hypothetical protein
MAQAKTVRAWLEERIEHGKPLNDPYSRRVLKVSETYGLDISLKQARGHGELISARPQARSRQTPIFSRLTSKERTNYEIGFEMRDEAKRLAELSGKSVSFDEMFARRSESPLFSELADKRTIRELFRSALTPEGYFKQTDNLERPMFLYDRYGKYSITVKGARQASKIGDYHNAVKLFEQKGDASALEKFKGKYVTDSLGKRHRFITDRTILGRHIESGETDILHIYDLWR